MFTDLIHHQTKQEDYYVYTLAYSIIANDVRSNCPRAVGLVHLPYELV